MSNKLKTFTNGIIKENPVLVLVLGTCPTIATSTSVLNALGMGLAATFIAIFFIPLFFRLIMRRSEKQA